MSQFHVFDTYAVSGNGRILHFDVVLEEKSQEKALAHARDWLTGIGEAGAAVRAESCCFCHSSTEAPEDVRRVIASQGYAIIKLEGCPH
jgi:hypothetical protein